jgi:hypothetical protein
MSMNTLIAAQVAAHAAWAAVKSQKNHAALDAACRAVAAAKRAAAIDASASPEAVAAREASEAAIEAERARRRAQTESFYAAECAETKRLGYRDARGSSRFMRLGQPEWGQ